MLTVLYEFFKRLFHVEPLPPVTDTEIMERW